jgi:DNA-binding beta-propeller fold protein YncE
MGHLFVRLLRSRRLGAQLRLGICAAFALTTLSCPNPTSSGSNTSYYPYAADRSDIGLAGIYAFTIGSNGALSPNGTFTTSVYPYQLAISPNDDYLYVVNSGSTGSAGIFGYTIGAGGALTAITTGTSTTRSQPYGLAISPNGSYLYTANLTGTVSAFSIGGGGALTAITCIACSTTSNFNGPANIAISPNGSYLYVANVGSSGSAGISAFTIGSTGVLSLISTYTTGSGPSGLAISPNGNYLYVANYGSGSVSAFTIGSTDALTAISGSPFAAGQGATGVAVTPNGGYLYVTNSYYLTNLGNKGNSISAYAIGSAGALTPLSGSPFSVPYAGTTPGPTGIAISPGGDYLYTGNSNNGTISAFTIDSMGALSPAGAFSSGPAPTGISITTK